MSEVPSGRVSPQSELLLALAARVEREEPSRELDKAIALAIGWTWHTHPHDSGYLSDPACPSRLKIPRHYTTSLDSAVTLVPEYWYVAEVYFDIDGWNATLTHGLAGTVKASGNNAPTECAARAAAALRALAENPAGPYVGNDPPKAA